MKGGFKKVMLNDIPRRNSKGTIRFLDVVKGSQHKEDKAVLKEVEQMDK